jgi:hypothetical protein
MHELAFADAARPTPVVVLNLPLSEYSVGHELLLFSRQNALMLLPKEEFSSLDFDKQIFAIREAVWICSDPFSVRERFERPARIMWGLRWNEWKRRRWVNRLKNLLPMDYALAAAEFRNYLSSGHPAIPVPGKHAVDVLYPDDGDSKGRAFGQPLMLSLYHFVLSLPKTDRPKCAWDYPMAKATWLFFSRMESQGNYRIENFEEREEQSVMDELRAERESRKREAPEPAQSSNKGLATAPPNLTNGGGE